mgnify:CR=1 FL=1
MAKQIKIWLHGYDGRMGFALRQILEEEDSATTVGGHNQSTIWRKGQEAPVDDSTVASHLEAHLVDAVIDFSLPRGSHKLLEILQNTKEPPALLIATTGLDDGTLKSAKSLAQQSAVMIAPNTSLGVIATAQAAAHLAKQFFPRGFDIEIVESHHRHKQDSPSGTAYFYARSIQNEIPNLTLNTNRTGPRDRHEIGIQAVRGGNVFGEHTIRIMGDNEEIELTHRALNRKLFAQGALAIARWLCAQKPGLYTVEDFAQNQGR